MNFQEFVCTYHPVPAVRDAMQNNAIFNSLCSNGSYRGHITEDCISNMLGIQKCERNTHGKDLVNGLELKYSTLEKIVSKRGAYYRSQVSNLNTKTGDVIVTVSDDIFSRKIRFFYLPISAYKSMLDAKGRLSITFNAHGRTSETFRKYEMQSIDDLVQASKSKKCGSAIIKRNLKEIDMFDRDVKKLENRLVYLWDRNSGLNRNGYIYLMNSDVFDSRPTPKMLIYKMCKVHGLFEDYISYKHAPFIGSKSKIYARVRDLIETHYKN